MEDKKITHNTQKIDFVKTNKKNKREKLGILLFFLSVMFFIGIISFYIWAGHGFDKTALIIDDNAGQLNGYAAILVQSNTKDKNQNKENIDSRADISTLKSIYQEKKSSVLNIDVDNKSLYSSGIAVSQDKWKIGYVSLTDSELKTIASGNQNGPNLISQTSSYKDQLKTQAISNFQKKVDNLKEINKVDIVVCVSPTSEISRYINHIDCVIADTVEGENCEGTTVSGVYVSQIPSYYKCSIVLVSPAKSVNAKILDSDEVSQMVEGNKQN